MSTYTLCDCLLNHLDLDKKYITDVLMVFPQQNNPFKISLDKSNKILNTYGSIAEKNDIVATWLNLMTMKPSSFETIDVDLSQEDDMDEIYLTVCSSTKSQQKTIVNSHERWKKHKYNSAGIIIFKDVPVLVYDRDEAILDLNPTLSNNVTAIGSVVAIDKAKVKDIKINPNE